MSAELILIAGLPGSGKTMHMKTMRDEGWTVYDDFKANAYNDSSVFWHSRHFDSLIGTLLEGQKCVVADIDFCKDGSRDEAESAIKTQFPNIALKWVFFANNVEACRANIARRASHSIKENLRALATYQALYRIPSGAHILPVWTHSE
jgi:RNase adaptor protein for sRNA GlmZ degradation